MSLTLSENKIKSLIALLDDDDNKAFELIREQILEIGPDLMPFLENYEDKSDNDFTKSRISLVYDELKLKKVVGDINEWRQYNYKNLFQGLAIIAAFQYPRLDISTVSGLLNKIRQEFWTEVNDNLKPLEKVKVLNRIFFNVYGFKGNPNDYYAPENSFLNDVILQRKGSPLMLSVLYSIIAQSLDIPIYGVNTPRNFMLAYLDTTYSFPVDEVEDKNILFYINPYNKGEIHSLKDIFTYLKRIGVNHKSEYYIPCSNSTILKRSISNIIVAYDKKSDKSKVSAYQEILKVFL